jgi:exonuclease VII large subunit
MYSLFSEQSTPLSVSELTGRVRSLVEMELGAVVVEGVVSNVRRPASGQCSFSL